jgi:tetratricopeptide (TPR) repeat protein
MNFNLENSGESTANRTNLAALDLPIEPATICEGIALLVSKDMTAEAVEMADLAVALFPQDPAILWMGSLMGQLVQDWKKAHDLLQQLKVIQGDEVALQTYQQLVRVLRCMEMEAEAIETIKVAMNRFPSDEALQSEYEFLIALNSKAAQSAS